MESIKTLEARYAYLKEQLTEYRIKYMELYDKFATTEYSEEERQKLVFLLELSKCETVSVYRQLMDAYGRREGVLRHKQELDRSVG